jgi:hypothetical protein
MPRNNKRSNGNLRGRPTGGGGDTGVIAKIRDEIRWRAEAQRAERSEDAPAASPGAGTRRLLRPFH